MDTLYQLLEWNPVQIGSTFQGGGVGLRGGDEDVNPSESVIYTLMDHFFPDLDGT